MIHVVASSKHRYFEYCKEKDLEPGKDAKPLRTVAELHGLRGRVEFAPGYDRAPNYLTLAEALRRKVSFGDITVPDWWLAAGAGGE